jgi:hypothetical protein
VDRPWRRDPTASGRLRGRFSPSSLLAARARLWPPGHLAKSGSTDCQREAANESPGDNHGSPQATHRGEFVEGAGGAVRNIDPGSGNRMRQSRGRWCRCENAVEAAGVLSIAGCGAREARRASRDLVELPGSDPGALAEARHGRVPIRRRITRTNRDVFMGRLSLDGKLRRITPEGDHFRNFVPFDEPYKREPGRVRRHQPWAPLMMASGRSPWRRRWEIPSC